MNRAQELWLAAGWTMFHFLWLGAVIGLMAGISRTFVRRASPWLRYATALFWFGVLAASPLAIAAVIAQTSLQTPTTLALEAAAPSNISDTGDLKRNSSDLHVAELSQFSAGGASSAKAPLTSLFASSTPMVVQRAIDAVEPLASWMCGWLPWVWCCGSPLVMCLLMSGVVGADRLRRDAVLLADHPAVARCSDCAGLLGIRRPVIIGISERIAAPLLLGILRPMILLPPAVLAECSGEQIEMILWHELAHVRRWDNLVNFVQRLVEAVLFFHPIVWRVSAWVRLEREHCCDAVVLAHIGEPQAYAETLASLAMPELTPRLATASLANHQLVSRIRHILNLEDRAMRVSHKLAMVLSVGIIAGGVITYSMAQSTRPAPVAVAAPGQPSAGFVYFSNDSVAPAASEGTSPTGAVGITFSSPGGGGGPAAGAAVAPRAPAGTTTNAAPAAEGTGEAGSTLGLRVSVPALSAQGVPAAMRGAGMQFSFPTVQPTGLAAWTAAQVTGAPNTATAGDHTTAWASATPDGQVEWLQVEFAEPIETAAVLIHETFNPGAVASVQASGNNGQILAMWKGVDPVSRDSKSGLAIIPLATQEKVHRLIITIDSAAVPGWNEIDAVGILDVRGSTHWASGASASSSFGDTYVGHRALNRSRLNLVYAGDSSRERIGQLEQQMQQLQQSLDEIKSLLKAQAAPMGGGGGSAASSNQPGPGGAPYGGGAGLIDVQRNFIIGFGADAGAGSSGASATPPNPGPGLIPAGTAGGSATSPQNPTGSSALGPGDGAATPPEQDRSSSIDFFVAPEGSAIPPSAAPGTTSAGK